MHGKAPRLGLTSSRGFIALDGRHYHSTMPRSPGRESPGLQECGLPWSPLFTGVK